MVNSSDPFIENQGREIPVEVDGKAGMASGFISRLLNPLQTVGDVLIFFGMICRRLPKIFGSFHLTVEQMIQIGVGSLPLVFITSISAGATASWQTGYQLKGYAPLRFLGAAVGKSMIIELGPVMTALVVAGRGGASLAGAIGTMRVTDQGDALSTMGIDPIRYLMVPRLISALIMMPVLVIFSDLFGILGGFIVAVNFVGISSYTFSEGLKMFFYTRDIVVGLLKAVIFGGVIATLGCYYGYVAAGGAEGVGKAAIKAFVSSAVLILLFDYIIAFLAF